MKDYVQQAVRTESRPDSIKVNQFVLHDLMQMITALGNAADLVKKCIFYGKPIDVEKYHVYLSQVRQANDNQLEMIDQVSPEFLVEVLSPEYLAGMNPEVLSRLTGDIGNLDVRLLHCALGIHTEAGEMFEALQKQYAGQPLDMVNFAEELGDVDWYKAIGHDATGINEDSLRETNIAKLRKRYPEKFTDENALNRDLSAERAILELGTLDSKREAWECKIGDLAGVEIPPGGDAPMRQAVEEAYFALTGKFAQANFSGWGGKFTEAEKRVINHQT